MVQEVNNNNIHIMNVQNFPPWHVLNANDQIILHGITIVNQSGQDFLMVICVEDFHQEEGHFFSVKVDNGLQACSFAIHNGDNINQLAIRLDGDNSLYLEELQ